MRHQPQKAGAFANAGSIRAGLGRTQLQQNRTCPIILQTALRNFLFLLKLRGRQWISPTGDERPVGPSGPSGFVG